jgi:glycerol-3-phosphate cytidylyltransferase
MQGIISQAKEFFHTQIMYRFKELKDQGKKIGITFSAWDLFHAGHVAMLAEAKNHCDYLICGLQTDPTIDRPDTKNQPVQSIVERQIQLAACRYVDEVVVYQTEQDLIDLLLILPLDVRILGVEYEYKEFTGRAECFQRNIEVVFNKRDHSFSSSSLRKRVAWAESQRLLKNEPDREPDFEHPEDIQFGVQYDPRTFEILNKR